MTLNIYIIIFGVFKTTRKKDCIGECSNVKLKGVTVDHVHCNSHQHDKGILMCVCSSHIFIALVKL